LFPTLIHRSAATGFALVLLGVAFPSGAHSGADEPLQIRVMDGGWGNARTRDIERVLQSAARELRTYFPHRGPDRILVKHVPGNPRVLYERGPQGEYVVHLSATDRRWAEYAYQFAHELCHVLARYELRPSSGTSSHQWFEEALCETASLFVLRRLATAWESEPPYPHWHDYAPAFREFALALMDEPHRRAAEEPLARWYRAHREALARDPYLRPQNELIATRLLVLFEEQPGGWGALDCLNAVAAREAPSLGAYLQGWHRAAPSEHRAFLQKLLALFGVAAGRDDRAGAPGSTQQL
jgi:hypothetical protein